MKASLLALVLFGAPLVATACETLPPQQQRKADRLDLQYQKDLVQDTAADADLIAMVRVSSVSPDRGTATFIVERRIKGVSDNEVSLALDQTIVVGCYASSWFFSTVNLESSDIYILYAKDGKVLRARPKYRLLGEVSLRQELRLIRKRLGPNNSFKPNPLRGSA